MPKRSRLNKKWVSFRHKGKTLAKISVEGLYADEISETKNLLAFEKGLKSKDISVVAE